MEKKLLDKLVDASLMITVVVAVMYFWGRQYLSAYVSHFGFSINQFEVSFAECTALGVHILIATIIGLVLGMIGTFFADLALVKFFKQKDEQRNNRFSKYRQKILFTISAIVVMVGILYAAFFSQVNGHMDAERAKSSTIVRIKTSSDLVFQGEPHLLLKLGGDYLIYDETSSGEGLIHIIPEEQVLQITHPILKK